MPSQSPSLEFCEPKSPPGPANEVACNFDTPSTSEGVSAGSCIGINACLGTTLVTSIGFSSCRDVLNDPPGNQPTTTLGIGVCQNIDLALASSAPITIGEQSW